MSSYPFTPKSPHHTRDTSTTSTTTLSHTKTSILINIYDLLPPGRLSTLLWTFGSSLLHSGVVINGKEYAYGGHNKRDTTGVYYTTPRYEPPGGTHRLEVLQGFTFFSEEEIEGVIKEVSLTFLGPSYNLLTHNCNHFTSALCLALTSRPAPAYLNRAAKIGLAMPCVVPREWISPPDFETADGELLEDEDEEADERSRLVDRRRSETEWEEPPRLVAIADEEGRRLPVAERAPVPKR